MIDDRVLISYCTSGPLLDPRKDRLAYARPARIECQAYD